MWYILVLLILIAAVLYPHIKIAYARLLLLKRLEKICSRKGCRLKILRRGVLFAGNENPYYDLMVETENRIVAIKIWSQAARDSVVIFFEGGSYSIKRTARNIIPSSRPVRVMASGVKRLPKPVRNFNANNNSVLPILLIYPAFSEIRYVTRDGLQYEIEPGDRIFEKTLTNYKLLEKIIME